MSTWKYANLMLPAMGLTSLKVRLSGVRSDGSSVQVKATKVMDSPIGESLSLYLERVQEATAGLEDVSIDLIDAEEGRDSFVKLEGWRVASEVEREIIARHTF